MGQSAVSSQQSAAENPISRRKFIHNGSAAIVIGGATLHGLSTKAFAGPITASTPLGYLWRIKVVYNSDSLSAGTGHVNETFRAANTLALAKAGNTIVASVNRTASGPSTSVAPAQEYSVTATGVYSNGTGLYPHAIPKTYERKVKLYKPDGTTPLSADVALGVDAKPKFKLTDGTDGRSSSGGAFVIEVGEFTPTVPPTGLSGKAYIAMRTKFTLDDQSLFRIKEFTMEATDSNATGEVYTSEAGNTATQLEGLNMNEKDEGEGGINFTLSNKKAIISGNGKITGADDKSTTHTTSGEATEVVKKHTNSSGQTTGKELITGTVAKVASATQFVYVLQYERKRVYLSPEGNLNWTEKPGEVWEKMSAAEGPEAAP